MYHHQPIWTKEAKRELQIVLAGIERNLRWRACGPATREGRAVTVEDVRAVTASSGASSNALPEATHPDTRQLRGSDVVLAFVALAGTAAGRIAGWGWFLTLLAAAAFTTAVYVMTRK